MVNCHTVVTSGSSEIPPNAGQEWRTHPLSLQAGRNCEMTEAVGLVTPSSARPSCFLHASYRTANQRGLAQAQRRAVRKRIGDSLAGPPSSFLPSPLAFPILKARKQSVGTISRREGAVYDAYASWSWASPDCSALKESFTVYVLLAWARACPGVRTEFCGFYNAGGKKGVGGSCEHGKDNREIKAICDTRLLRLTYKYVSL